MITSIFVNLPVKDLERSKAFFTALGCTINKQFTDETAASIVIGENLYAMLLTHEKYKQFTAKEIANAALTSEVLVALGVDRKTEVDRIVDAAVNAGGKETRPPQDYGFMQMRVFEDLDGHHWEVFYMDPAHVQPA
jgi:predicted lactoylglutathione lyase